MQKTDEYAFLDSGEGKKLEKFGNKILIRPCSQALWKPFLPHKNWLEAEDEFTRSPKGQWRKNLNKNEFWNLEHKGVKFKLEKTSFGHVGLFPEHLTQWPWLKEQIVSSQKKVNDPSILNLFAYTGSASMYCSKLGAQVCHVDASMGMVDRAKENAALNELQQAPIRWIVDDVFKFLKREIKRERQYQGVILDPPSFGRGSKGEVFKIEKHLIMLLELVRDVLSDDAQFVLFTCHTPGITPLGLENLFKQIFKKGSLEVGELKISNSKHQLPGGIYGRISFS